MQIVLVSLPFASPMNPGLGIALVAASLRRLGHQVKLVDGIMSSFGQAWSSDRVQAGIDYLSQRLHYFAGRDKLSQSAAREYADSAELLVAADKMLLELPESLALLRGQSGDWDASTYDKALRIVQGCLRLSAAPYAPELLTLRQYRSPWPLKSETDLLRFAKMNPSETLLGTSLAEKLPQQIMQAFGEAPDLVGLSISWDPQLGPATMLGWQLRLQGYQGPLVWGGALMAHIQKDLNAAQDLRAQRIVDHVVVRGGGELLNALITQNNDDRPFIISAENQDSSTYTQQIANMPRPDFADLDLGQYLSPRPTLPLLASVGCYYHACTFCDHFHSMNAYRPRKVQDLVDDMKGLFQEHQARDFYLVDDCTPPKTMDGLADLLLKWKQQGGPEVNWITECRAELGLLKPGLLNKMAQSGCQMLLLGVESADDDVLKAMNKGVDRAQLSTVIKAISAAGIKVWTFYMLGFPTEDSDAAQSTHNFLVEHAAEIDAIAGGPFMVTRHSPIARQPENYAITLRTSKNVPLFDLIVEHSGAAMTAAQRDQHIDSIRKDPRLQHFFHPLVSEAHSLFLPRSYYHQADSVADNLPRSLGAIDMQALRKMQIEVRDDVTVQYFKYPTDPKEMPKSGKVLPQASAVISRVDKPHMALRATVPIGALVEQCQQAAALIEERIAQIEKAEQGTAEDVLEAIVVLAQAGLLHLTS